MISVLLSTIVALSASVGPDSVEEDPWIVYEGGKGPGAGKHIVLIAGDEEYRSEEALPMLAKILSSRHGFKCTMLFSTDPEKGTIDPMNQTHIPGLHHLKTADAAIMFLRFRELPDADMKHIDDYCNSGKPIIGIRTATHAFDYRRSKESPYKKYSWRNKVWKRGFGGEILGETWVSHHGGHGSQSTRGVINKNHGSHPVLTGVTDIWGPTDVYGINKLPENSKVLVWGQVLSGMKPTDPPLENKKNNPMMPLIWVREYTGTSGKASSVLCSTIGAAVDFKSAGLRRVMVNACYWGLGMKVPAKSNVDYVGTYDPSWWGFGSYRKGLKPSDLKIK